MELLGVRRGTLIASGYVATWGQQHGRRKELNVDKQDACRSTRGCEAVEEFGDMSTMDAANVEREGRIIEERWG